MAHPPQALLMVLDGFGIGKDSPWNAIQNAKMPFYKKLWQDFPHSQRWTHGKYVGLPDGVMGNSEVGPMTMGAGRTIYQDLTRISMHIETGEFYKNTEILKCLRAGAASRVHFMGLLSDGGVHSHIEHLEALLSLSLEMGLPSVSVHVFTDGRDTSPTSGVNYLERLLRHPAFAGPKPMATIASLSGRYYAMDRDKRWDRVEKAYLAMTGKTETQPLSPLQALQAYYQQDPKGDEFATPMCFEPTASVKEGDSILFFNYRSDRAREISEAFTAELFSGFNRGPKIKLSYFLGMTQYDQNLNLPIAFQPQNLNNLFGSWLEQKNLSQYRLAETEKYAHVTFFFNGGREAPFKNEERQMIASPKDVATYDLKPEMSAFEVAASAKAQIESGRSNFVLMNFANADMVGHTGNYEATVRAMETLDRCLETVIGAAERAGYHSLITADHGNAEEMCDSEGHAHTQHTLNPVPALWIAPHTANAPRNLRLALQDGILADIMPTLCDLMRLDLPTEVTGKSLLPKDALKDH